MRVSHVSMLAVLALVLFSTSLASAQPGAPVLGTVTDATGGTAHLTWTNDSETPAQFLGYSWDIYTRQWVSQGWENSIWYPFEASATSGTLDLGYAGAYHVWIANQYQGGGFHPCSNPWTGIVYDGKPHAPADVEVVSLGDNDVRLEWKPDIYGTWLYWIIAYNIDEKQWVVTGGPLGESLWHYVQYGAGEFTSGTANLTVPSSGQYKFFLAGMAWDGETWGDFSVVYTDTSVDSVIMLPGDVPMGFVSVPEGSFLMGAYSGEKSSRAEEYPQHRVNMAYKFHMGKYETTKAQWRAVMGTTPWSGEEYVLDDPQSPACYVSWDDVAGPGGFVEKLNQHVASTGQGPAAFRLPSEAEWEYACRAGTLTRYYWDDDPSNLMVSHYAWYRNNTALFREYYAHVVGRKRPNGWGLYDMTGNMREWCEDWWHDSYTGAPTDGSSWVLSPTDNQRVLRGGDWSSHEGYFRSADRQFGYPDDRNGFFGFRLVRTQNDPLDTITIDVTPDEGGWTLTGPSGFTLAGTGDRYSTWTITGLLAGEYSLVCDDNIPGYDPPMSETLTLASGGTVNFAPSYVREPFDYKETTITLPGGVPLVLVRIPAGKFEMGSPYAERSRDSDEGPVHTVTFASYFYIGKYEVTQAQWSAVMGGWLSSPPDSSYGVGDNYPVYYVSWDDIAGAGGFVEKLNQHITSTGQGPAAYRLPSEAEWEYSCRARTRERFFFGDSLSVDDKSTDGPAGTLPGNRSDYMWFGGANAPDGSKEVGTKLPNQFGLYDMSGNVSELCEDWYYSSYSGAPADGSSWILWAGTRRVLRGGHYENQAGTCRSARRLTYSPDSRTSHTGFRLVRDVE